MCELGRVDMLHEVALLSQCMVQPRTGHMQQPLNILFYLDTHSRAWMFLDTTKFDITWKPRKNDASLEERADSLRELHGDVRNELHP